MLKTLIVGRGLMVREWADALRLSGFEVQIEPDSDALGPWLENTRFGLVVIDFSRTSGTEGALIPTIREAWPDCRVIAILTSHAFHSDTVHRMGVWEPDHILIKPVAPALLTGTARLLAARNGAA